MNKVITLVANTKKQLLDERIINKIFVKVEKTKSKIVNLQWLADDEACDIYVDSSCTLDEIRVAAAKALEEIGCDFFVQEDDNRKKKLLISDMDSTIINQECIDEIADKLGIKDKVSSITESAMNGEIDFNQSLKQRVALLKGVSEVQLNEVLNNDISLTQGAHTLVQTMKKNGAKSVLVSGGFTFFTSNIGSMVGFDENFANILEIKNGVLTGNVIEPILSAKSKLEIMNDKITEHNIEAKDVVAVGDGANDLMMLEAAGLGFAYHAKQAVQDKTQFHVNHCDLTALLYAQGYKKQDFV